MAKAAEIGVAYTGTAANKHTSGEVKQRLQNAAIV